MQCYFHYRFVLFELERIMVLDRRMHYITTISSMIFLLLFHMGFVVYLAMMIKRFIRRQHLIDVTEVFRNLNTDKKHRMIKLGVYMIFFTICVFRFVLNSVYNYPGFPLSTCFNYLLV
ncbi:hypothetical protein NC651_035104 [Populus alba x Populus x berolinensis]|nr:hypothetical protein NC651_035104 [Populus alba x Populus x berolinensis]